MTVLNSKINIVKKPPTRGLSILIQRYQAIFQLWDLLEAEYQKYGDIYIDSFGDITQVLLSNPQAIEQVFTADPNLFAIGKFNRVLEPLLGEYSLIMLDGVEHQKQRKLLMPPFHGERMKAYGQIIIDVTERAIGQWQVGKPFQLREYAAEISLQVIVKAVFGINKTEQYQELIHLLSSCLDIFNSPLKSTLLMFTWLQKDLGSWSPWGQFIRKKKRIEEILSEAIAARRDNSQLLGEDILSLMLSVRDENGAAMTDSEIKDELMTMLFAGHETTANSLAWAFYWIYSHREVRQKLLDELNDINDNTDPNMIAKLPYLSAVVAETLRISPTVVGTFVRQLKQPMELMGYKFAAGTIFSPCIYLVHQREDIYPEPKKFKPERFLKPDPLDENLITFDRPFSAYEYLPFGGGNRRCLGYAFALFEMKLVLGTILARSELTLLDRKPLKPMRRGVTFSPSGGVKMALNKLNLEKK
ncbi:MAG: cytochrome P450 [Prochloraceae cyanobacterium]|nr:cytochrome P450 [Prochloraceae cyanobacterium]